MLLLHPNPAPQAVSYYHRGDGYIKQLQAALKLCIVFKPFIS
jgi:hypothetical protein